MEVPRIPAAGRDLMYETVCAVYLVDHEAGKIRHIYKRTRGLIGNTRSGVMASLGWLPRISKFFQGKDSESLPEDLELEIVSRLPVEDVLKCSMVCKRWMAVTLTPRFFDLHQKRAPPMIMLQNYDRSDDMKLYSLDLTHDKPYIRRFDTAKLFGRDSYLVATCDGLLLLNSPENHSLCLSICNPLTGRVITGVTARGHFCCGFWFHPSKREYLFLTATRTRDHGSRFCYKILNLRGESTVVGFYKTFPSHHLPTNISGSLHFLLKDSIPPKKCIMIFNTESEKINFQRHPHDDHCYEGHGLLCPQNRDMRLLEMEGSLAFAHVCSDSSSLYIWILADRAAWRWNKRYKINLKCDDIHHPLNEQIHPLEIQRGEMLMLYGHKRLIALNLETRRIRKINLNIVSYVGYTSLVSTTCGSSLVGLNRLALI